MILEKIGKEFLIKKGKKIDSDLYKYKNLYFQITSKNKIDVFYKIKNKEIPF